MTSLCARRTNQQALRELEEAPNRVAKKGFMDDFRRFFLRGLAVLVPSLLTFAILVWSYHLINDNVAVFLTRGLVRLCATVSDKPPEGWIDEENDALRYGTPLNEWDELGRRITIEHLILENYRNLTRASALSDVSTKIIEKARRDRNRTLWRLTFTKYKLHLLGFVIAIVLVYFIGFFLASFIGRACWRAAESLLGRVPVIRAIFPNVKKVTDFLLAERSVGFSSVVLVQYPRKGVWSLGLSTGAPMDQLQKFVDDDFLTVFIPSSPTPITGYVIQISRKDVIELNMTVDEGLRFTISAGVIKPEGSLPVDEG